MASRPQEGRQHGSLIAGVGTTSTAHREPGGSQRVHSLDRQAESVRSWTQHTARPDQGLFGLRSALSGVKNALRRTLTLEGRAAGR